jgi:hypothetical protein
MATLTKNAFRQQSVKEFWQGVNWENIATRHLHQSSTMPMTLSVQDYFAMIPWSGIAIAQSRPKPILIEEISNTETLEDFLDDISKFF